MSTVYHFVAPVRLKGGRLYANTGEGRISVRLGDAIDRLPGGLQPGGICAVWTFERRPSPAEAVRVAHEVRVNRLLVYIGSSNELLQLDPSYNLQIQIES